MIERNITIGMITSTEFLKHVEGILNIRFFESSTAKMLCQWCKQYYETYKKAPFRDIESLYYEHRKEGRINDDLAEEIEQDILPSLNEEYENNGLNVEYLLDQTKEYFNRRNIELYANDLKGLLAKNQLLEAEKLAGEYVSIIKDTGEWVDLSSERAMETVGKAFSIQNETLVYFPKELGIFWNQQMVREGFVALMGTEKRGKTFWLLEFALRGCRQGRKVAFFQAGDMSERQQIRRICIYLTKKSDRKSYSGKMWETVKDCTMNQTDECDKDERECNFGVFRNTPPESLKKTITRDELKRAYKDNPDYLPCTNCKDQQIRKYGTVWLKEVDTGNPLTEKEAKEAVEKFFVKNKRNFYLSSHANGTLTVDKIRAELDIWEQQDTFVPDIIVVDYADILEDNTQKDFRHKQNKIWKDLRGLSQSRRCLVITATQTDADAYKKDLLSLDNFSEDKRKYAHVTAMYGLNQDKEGREKELGVMRINELVVREGDFNNKNVVYVLQNLRRGRPFLGSFY